MTLPSCAEALFSLKSFAAAMLALYVAMAMGSPRPFWAMMTAYIVSGPLSGTVRSKAVFRVVGTVVGSTATVLMVPALAQAPELLALALALWVAACLYVSLLDRTPRSYLFMLAGYTAGVIGFPGVSQPDAIFDTGLARVEEILLGIACATLVHSVVFPQGVGPVLLGRLDAILGDAERWTLDVLSGRGAETSGDRQKLARDLTELRVMATHLPYDTTDVRRAARPVRALQDRMAYLLPILAAIEDRLAALRADGAGPPPGLAAVLEDVKRWIAADEAEGGAGALHDALARLQPPVAAAMTWRDATLLNLLTRLRALVDIHGDCRELRARIRRGDAALPGHLDPLTRSRSRRVFHLDRGMALWSAAAAVLAILSVCAFWIATGWTSGASAAMMVTIFSCFFAALDDPVPGLRLFLTFTLASVPIAGAYLLFVLPAIDSFVLLALVLAPTFLVLGAYAARPATTGKAMAMLLGTAGSLSLLDTGQGDVASFLSGSFGQVAGIVTAMTVMRLCRSVGAAWSARRLLRAGWRDVAALAAGRGIEPAAGFQSRMLDRVGLLSTRLALAGPHEDLAAADAVNDLRTGLNIAELQRAQRALDRPSAAGVETLLDALGRHFRTLPRRAPTPLPPAVRAGLDTALSGVVGAAPGAERDRAVVALAGLRRSLFPEEEPA
ncbi:FUSC family protein [Azospirillum sp. ST 5-10]|uniref:FUSC family protein n=1 Tax=unclassified Azospirillum TaxID=2630922 RepID=UPI003F49DB05